MLSEKKQIILGATMALAVYMMLFSSIAPVTTNAYAAGGSYFSLTLIAPTSNPVRRQYASIISNSFRDAGIDAKVFYVTFDQLVTRLFFGAVPTNADGSVNWAAVEQADFAHGGYDLGFIGWGATGLSPDGSFGNYLGDYSDWAPNGNNYYLYNNSKVTGWIDEIESSTNFTLQQADLWNIQATLLNDTPSAVVYYTNWVIARNSALKDYGSQNVWSEITFPDVQHYSGGATLNFAEAGSVFPNGNLNPLPTTASNSFYSLFMYSDVLSGLQEIDSSTNSYYLALANYIHSTPDSLNWTINFKPNNFQDGVPVTSDDFVFTYQSLFNPQSGYVGQGSMLTQLGTQGQFTYLNGTTVTIDQTPANTAPAVFYVTAVDKNTFTIDLPHLYAFMNITWTGISPLPKHYFEQYNITTWDSLPYCQATPYTFKYSTAQYGGNGTATFGGPFSNGPYIFQGFDTTANTAHLVAWEGYWNATGLESIGQFTVKNYNVVWVASVESAIAGLKDGSIQQLDTNYGLPSEIPTLEAIPGVTVLTGPEMGYQEMGINCQNPVWGTGVATPNGQVDPANAARYAADVRKAFSLLIPRQLIVANLLSGVGSPGITPWPDPYGSWVNPNVTADPYDPAQAAQYLKDAGYAGGSPLPPATVPSPAAIPSNAILLWGTPITVSGSIIYPTTGVPFANTELTLQSSYDWNGTAGNWTNVASTVTDPSGGYSVQFVPTQPGIVFLRWSGWPLVTGSMFSPIFNYTTTSLGAFINTALTPYASSAQVTSLQTQITALQSSINTMQSSLQAKINSLQDSVNSVTYVAYAAVVIGIIALIVAFLMSRRK